VFWAHVDSDNDYVWLVYRYMQNRTVGA